MSVQATAWVFRHSDSTLAARLVLLVIADHANSEGVNAWPSQRLIAEEAKVDERTVRRCVDTLVELGELTVHRHKGRKGPKGTTHAYSLPKFQLSTGRSNCPVPDSEGGQFVQDDRTSDPKRGGEMSAEPSFNHPEPPAANESSVGDNASRVRALKDSLNGEAA